MKKVLFLILVFSMVYLPSSFAQDYTQWGLPEGAIIRLDKGTIHEIKYSADGTRLAVASRIGVWIYDTQTGEELDLFIGHTDTINSISFSPDGKTRASGSSDNTIRLWDVETGRTLHTLTGHTDGVNSVAFSPDGGTLATGSWDSTVLLWQLTDAMPEPEKRPEDINGDGIINISDLVFVAANFGQKGEHPADVNKDGIVDVRDLVLVAGALDLV